MIFSFLFFSNLFSVNDEGDFSSVFFNKTFVNDEKTTFFLQCRYLFNFWQGKKKINNDFNYFLDKRDEFRKMVKIFLKNSEKKIEYIEELEFNCKENKEFKKFYNMVLKTLKKEKSVDEFLNFIYKTDDKNLLLILPIIFLIGLTFSIVFLIFVFFYFPNYFSNKFFPYIFPIMFPLIFPTVFPVICPIIFPIMFPIIFFLYYDYFRFIANVFCFLCKFFFYIFKEGGISFKIRPINS